MKTLQILAPSAFAPALLRLSEIYGHCDLNFRWGPAAGAAPTSIVSQLKSQTAADAALLPGPLMSQQIQNGYIDQNCRAKAFKTCIAVAVSNRRASVELDTMDRLEAALLGAENIGVSEAGSGLYVRDRLIPRFKSSERITTRLRVIDGPVGKAVRDGEVELGFQQRIELMAIEGITILHCIPEAAMNPTPIEIGAIVGSPNQQEVKDFAAFFASNEAGAVLNEMGLDAP
ncbi:substrate-binding domain-containing protein [Pelagibacterium limicola]|uniref:substrate-binding domain-containing protein n=1 Tax=Pelagibacterium limicola TaxID=2791022 RepID=UPI0018AF8F0D|nr:substrate-binding domain-containing protein [Pelagibacterium limicola]